MLFYGTSILTPKADADVLKADAKKALDAFVKVTGNDLNP